MSTPLPKTASTALSADTSNAVNLFMLKLEHPQKPAIEALRRIIVQTDSRIAEGVKWNAPSFRTTEYFATTHLRVKSGIGLILHFGVKARALPNLDINDPERLLTWLAKDRAMVSFSDAATVTRRRSALQAIVRQWLFLV
jgi:hypothetical protein